MSNYKHGLTQHPLYKVWKAMRNRCVDKNNKFYNLYGGRGVRVCDEWDNDFASFYSWSVAAGYRKGLQLDKDKLSPTQTGLIYSPQYCCYLTPKENSQNRSHNKLIQFQGRCMSLSAWCEQLNLIYNRTKRRLLNGWSIERAFLPHKFENKKASV